RHQFRITHEIHPPDGRVLLCRPAASPSGRPPPRPPAPRRRTVRPINPPAGRRGPVNAAGLAGPLPGAHRIGERTAVTVPGHDGTRRDDGAAVRGSTGAVRGGGSRGERRGSGGGGGSR